MGWGLAAREEPEALATLLPEVNDAAERRRIALDHLAKSLARARRLAAALDQAAPSPPSNLELYLVAGDAVPTPRSVSVDPETGRVRVTAYQEPEDPGEAGHRACVDFTEAGGKVYDVDVVVSTEGGQPQVTDVYVHKVEGEVVKKEQGE